MADNALPNEPLDGLVMNMLCPQKMISYCLLRVAAHFFICLFY